MRPHDVAVIVHHDRPGEQPGQLLDALERQGRSAALVSVRDLSLSVSASRVELLWRGGDFSPSGVLTQGLNRSWSFVSQILSELEARAIPVVNPVRGSTLALDKVATLRTLAHHDVALLAARALPWGARVGIEAPYDGPLVTKPNGGSNGHGVVTHETWDEARVLLGADRVLGPDGLVGTEVVQPLASAAGVDARVLVVGEQALVTVRRRARVGIVANWNNADVELWSHVDVESAAVAAVAALGLAYGAVDLVEHEGRWGVLEVNCWPRDLEVMGRIGGLDALGRVVALLG